MKMPAPIAAYPPTSRKDAQSEAALRPMGSARESAIKPSRTDAAPSVMTVFPRADSPSKGDEAEGSPPAFGCFFSLFFRLIFNLV